MALRDQPYLPLYVQDFMCDEKLRECDAESVGVYIFLMCLMHKSEEYGIIRLRGRDRNQSETKANFANKLARQLPFRAEVIERALDDLVGAGVLSMDEDTLFQKRMVRDADISAKRTQVGERGGKNVKNSNKRKLYNESGYLYIIEDCDDPLSHKVGISKQPKKKLSSLRSKSGKRLRIAALFETDDMGLAEDNVLTALDDDRDGEWIAGVTLEHIIDVVKTVSPQSIIKANTEYEIESDSENIDDNGDLRSTENVTVDEGEAGEISFEAFWKAYPKKVGKKDARKAFRRVDAPLESLLSAIERQKCADQWKRDGGRFIPNPSTWLNQGRWEDELTVAGDGGEDDARWDDYR